MEKEEMAMEFFSNITIYLDKIYFWSTFILGIIVLILFVRYLISAEPTSNGASEKGDKEYSHRFRREIRCAVELMLRSTLSHLVSGPPSLLLVGNTTGSNSLSLHF